MANAQIMSSTGVDTRLNSIAHGDGGYVPPQHRLLHDPNVTFEEYHFYAQACRREEAQHAGSAANKSERGGIMSTIFPGRNSSKSTEAKPEVPEVNTSDKDARMQITDEEWTNASRALRLATWPSMFYLITTDILGPYTLPYAIATTGWGPGLALYTVFGVLAGYSGYLLWHMFLGLDSYHYPLRTYGDLSYRIFGKWARHGTNILQSIQLLCNVGVIVIQNGQSLSQVAKFKLCYVICCLIFAILGFFIGQIRTLQKFGFIANSAIWLNLLVIFITMGVGANSLPNYDAVATSAGAAIEGAGGPPLVTQLADGSWPKVQTSGGLPVSSNFSAAVVGLMQAVYSYGGAMLFTEFMSEMRRPVDFIKAMWGAQAFIYFFYMFYGCFLYAYQGQYTVNPSYQGMSPYHWQVAGNVLAMISALIAAGLYGNIGIKVLYNNIFTELFNAPPLTSKRGKLLWAIIVPIYWTIAFIIAAAIPAFSALTAVVAAACILQFTYTFPPILYLGYILQRDTLRNLGLAPKENHSKVGRISEVPEAHRFGSNDSGSDTNNKEKESGVLASAPSYAASGHSSVFRPSNVSKSERSAAFKKAVAKQWYNVIWLMVYFLGALVTAALGMYSAIETLIVVFADPQVTAFTCHSPLDAS